MTSIDLSSDRAARRARKRGVVVQVEFAATRGSLTTQEGPVNYSPDDALLTGTEGERWPVPRDAFDVTLDRDRGTLRGQAGDWLVQYAPSDFSVVSAHVFAQTYELLD